MLIATLALNIVILIPVIAALLSDRPGIAAAFGADTVARRILTCLYGAIALVSFGLIAAHLTDRPWAVTATFTLFAAQIAYKSATVFAVGPGSPVVVTNIAIIAVQIAVTVIYSGGGV